MRKLLGSLVLLLPLGIYLLFIGGLITTVWWLVPDTSDIHYSVIRMTIGCPIGFVSFLLFFFWYLRYWPEISEPIVKRIHQGN
jgi:hypothetical protein